jgi:hypothetical protein
MLGLPAAQAACATNKLMIAPTKNVIVKCLLFQPSIRTLLPVLALGFFFN